MLTETTKNMAIEGLNMKIASIKRAQNSNKSPKFVPVYDAELAEAEAAMVELKAIKIK